ncbi:MAG: DNA polymerase-3 subunit beta [Glaciecola sp.]|jgi:DNA polymerase-3 subunit beta
MKLQLGRAEFAEAIGWATRLVGPRPHLPVLSGVLLTADDGRLTCSAHDLEVAGQVQVAANIERTGRALLPGKLLAGMAAKLPDAPVQLAVEGDDVTIDCGRAHFTLRGMRAEDYPGALEPIADAPTGILKADAFNRMVTQVARAAATEEARPMLTGVKLEAREGELSAAATDSYRMAMRSLRWEKAVDAEALVPARALMEAAKAAQEAGGEVAISFEEGQVTFMLGDRRLTTRLIEAAFPNVRGLLPDSFETVAVVERAALLEALSRVSVVTQGQVNTPVNVTFGDGSVELRAGGQEGAAQEAMPADVDGETIEIAFNPTYLASGLEATGTEFIRVELRDGLKPAVLRPQAAAAEDGEAPKVEDFTYLLMPMRVN